jgi:glycosyltransferase involved in cell wall biosynthesis
VGKKAVGVVGEERLQRYIRETDVVVLPIRSGGGSNLKTAEALYARKKIVATSFSFRGFEAFRHFPGVHVADNPDSFERAMLKAVQDSEVNYSWQQRKQLERLLWTNCLRPLGYLAVLAYGLYFLKRIKIAR